MPKRAYHAGEVLRYEMRGSNEGWEYQIEATSIVKVDKAGQPYEEIGWSDLHSNAPGMTLSPESLRFRQTVSADGSGRAMSVPDLRGVQPFLIGPITDLLTIFGDLTLARASDLRPEHTEAYVANGKPNSWADGQHFLIAEDAIDFDLRLESTDPEAHTATLLVKHVVPKNPAIQTPAAWMQPAGAGSEAHGNNWVQVSHSGSSYLAEVGQETFEVQVTLDSRDGKIISVELSNPVKATQRTCEDAELTRCGAGVPETILRVVSLQLQ